MNGTLPIFKIDEVSLVDIEKLIDIGYRFDLKPDNGSTEFTDLERYVKNGTSGVRLYKQGERSL